jgi:RNA polymerase sigma-70 factor (ECF subfamily)
VPPAGRAGAPSFPEEDRELRHRFRDGDPDAVRELHDRFSRSLLRVAQRYLLDPEQARDAVQQTMLQAWRAASRFDVDRDIAPWLFQICRRVCIDTLRAERRTEALDEQSRDRTVADRAPTMEQAWTVFEVRRAIDELPPDARDIVRLMHLDGWSVQQTADLLDLPVGTVKSRSFRAHRRLGTTLAHLRAPAGS